MGKAGPGSWTLPRLTDIEKFHAAILYSRPVGNTQPDVDPASWLFSMGHTVLESASRRIQ
jgi:hypothetical protein